MRHPFQPIDRSAVESVPINPVFAREIASPLEIVTDPALRVSHAVYFVNRELIGPPVVYMHGLTGANSDPKSQSDLNSVAHYVKRPIYSIDAPAFGLSSAAGRHDWSLQDLAEAHGRIMTDLSIDELDLVGNSLGGLMAARAAVELGSRVGQLITLATPGMAASWSRSWVRFIANIAPETEASKNEYIASSHPSVADDIRRLLAGRKQQFSTPSRVYDMLYYVHLMAGPALHDLPTSLHPETVWTDVAAIHDRLTKFEDHIKLIGRRNALYADSSRSILLPTDRHYLMLNSPATAKMVSKLLG